MKNSISIKPLLFLSLLTIMIVSCDKKDDKNKIYSTPPTVLSCDFFHEDRTLEKVPNAQVDYIITCIMKVKGDIIIEPGVIIEFENKAGIDVEPRSNISERGSLSAVGTEKDPIVFRGTQEGKGFWSGIRFYNTNATYASNELTHVVIDGAGWPGFGTRMLEYEGHIFGGVIAIGRDPNLKITNTTISNSFGYGLNIEEKSLSLVFENNTFIKNDTIMKTHLKHLNSLDKTSSYKGNLNDIIYINTPKDNSDGLGINSTWKNIDVPYYIKTNPRSVNERFDIVISSDLEIEAGVEIIMSSNSYIVVTGLLNMNGTYNDKIIFRGEKGIPGFWGGIDYVSFQTTLHNKMSYVDIRDAGRPTGTSGALYVSYVPLSINDITFNNCLDFGISIRTNDVQIPESFSFSNLNFINTPRKIGNSNNVDITP